MKIISLGIIGGILGAFIGCNLINSAEAGQGKWDGCSVRMVETHGGMVRVHDCNEH